MTPEEAPDFKAQSLHYLENALGFLAGGEAAKASEFLWGCMAEALKCVAASRGLRLRSHRELWNYALDLTRELGDESLFEAFKAANSLHSNFYESGLTIEDVALEVGKITQAVDKLLGLMPLAPSQS